MIGRMRGPEASPAGRPEVSVLVPVRNEEVHIRDAVATMLAQDYAGGIEFLFIEGMSEDRSREILDELAETDARIRVLENPRKGIPYALNIGLRNARGEFVVRMDGHSYYPPHYIATGVERLRAGDVEWVSGPQIPVGVGKWSRRVALALRSRFATAASLKWPSVLDQESRGDGEAPSPGQSEHPLNAASGVFGGVWRRATLEALGGWDEAWAVNEDSELLARFVEAGAPCVLRSDMGASYIPRDSLASLARQYWRYGQYRDKTSRRHPTTLRPLHLLPPTAILGLAVSLLRGGRTRRLAARGLAAYGAALGVETLRAGRRAPLRDVATLPLVFATMHAAWGCGYLVGGLRFGPPLAAIARLVVGPRRETATGAAERAPVDGARARPLRVLHVTESFASGVFGVVSTVAGEMAAKGHEVTIAYGRRPETPENVRDLVDPAVRLVELPWRTRALGEEVRAGLALRRLIAPMRPDVVHLHSSFAGMLGVLACPRAVPLVYSPHAYSFLTAPAGSVPHRVYTAAERGIAKRVSVIGAVSNFEAEQARRIAPRARVAVVPNGIAELDAPADDRTPEGRDPMIIVVGRIGPQRNPAGTARILNRVRDVAAAVWVGAEPSPGRDTEALRAAGVEITGWLSRAETTAYMRRAVALLHWSAWEGQSLAILEALAAGVPVVASDIPPNREVLGESQVFADEEAAAQTLRELVRDPALRARFLDNQSSRRGFYSAARMTDQWLELYELVADLRHGRLSAERGDGTVAGLRIPGSARNLNSKRSDTWKHRGINLPAG
jgi:succinoglycan biosynthesis protein ExoA